MSARASLALLADVARAGELKVDLIELEPWAMPAEGAAPGSAHYRGIVPDPLAEFSRRSGYTVNAKLTPYRRVEHAPETDKWDFALMTWDQACARTPASS